MNETVRYGEAMIAIVQKLHLKNRGGRGSLPGTPGWSLYHSDSLYVPQLSSSTAQQYNCNHATMQLYMESAFQSQIME